MNLRWDDGAIPPTFAAAGRFRPHFLTIYLRRLGELGFAVEPRLFACECERYNGDLIERGIGEILVFKETGEIGEARAVKMITRNVND